MIKISDNVSVSSEAQSQLTELALKLSASIQAGDKDKATTLLHALVNERPKLDINISVPQEENAIRKQEKEFSVKVHVEDREAAGGVFEVKVKSCDTIGDLKKKFFLNYGLPIEVQRWIIGKRIPDDVCTLHKCGVRGPDATLFLYVITAHSVGLTREDFEANSKAYTGNCPKPLNAQLSASSDGSSLGTVFMPITAMGNSVMPNLNTSSLENSLPQMLDTLDLYKNSSPNSTMPRLNQEPHNAFLAPLLESSGFTEMSANNANVVNTQSLASPSSDSSVVTVSQASESGVVTVSHIENAKDTILVNAPPENLQLQNEPVKPGWSCPSCTFHNLPTRPGCEMCSANRPESYVIPSDYQMTPEELMRIATDEEMERRTREEEAQNVLKNFAFWMETDNRDLVENIEEFTCPICFDDIPSGQGVMLRECLHMFCRDCLSDAVLYCEESVLKCPFQDDDYTCAALLQDREIRALVPENIYLKYLQRSLDEAESKAENSYHCKTTDCPGWCLYEDDVNFFTCPVCTKRNCLTCKAIHEGLNCQEYQTNLDENLETNDDARQTKKLLELLLKTGVAMRCPQCKVILQKKDGCDWLKCSICKTEICWVTQGARWGPGGSGDTSGGCRCRVEGQKCHPDCINCH